MVFFPASESDYHAFFHPFSFYVHLACFLFFNYKNFPSTGFFHFLLTLSALTRGNLRFHKKN